MAQSSDLDRVTSIVLRFTRGPILVLITVYAIGIIGMSLMPGVDAQGNPHRMDLFHAFYFFTYTATTTGFGEIPVEYSNEQRLWTILCLYMGVIAWLYVIGSIFKLVQNPHFVSAVAERRFARSVRMVNSPFYIVCGFGDTGSLLARGFSDHGMVAVIIDGDEERIKALALRDYNVSMPGLCADASVPKHLVEAGIQHTLCQGIIALSADEDLNLKIAVMARYLNPDAEVICRTTSQRHQQHLEAMQGVTVINPFELFAAQLGLAVNAPVLYTLSEWFIGARGVKLDEPVRMREGPWILCGYGRMGSCIQKELTSQGIETVVIDPEAEDIEDSEQVICDFASSETLAEAGIEQAAGLVAGTDADAKNLGILLSAKKFNSDAFLIVRQNQHENELAFSAASVDLIMQASLVTARNILLRLIAPGMQTVIDHLEMTDYEVSKKLARLIRSEFKDSDPDLLSVTIGVETPAVLEVIQQGFSPCIADLIRDPTNRQKNLVCIPLAFTRNGETTVLPTGGETLVEGDVVLFCASERDVERLLDTLSSTRLISYLITGYEKPQGYFFRWLTQCSPQVEAIARKLDV